MLRRSDNDFCIHFFCVPSVDKRVDNDLLQLLHGRQAAAGECPGQPGSVRGRCVAVPLCPGGPGGRGGQTEVRGLAGLLSSHCPAPHLSPDCHQQSPATEDHRGQHHLQGRPSRVFFEFFSLTNSCRKTDGFPQGLYNLSITNTGLTEFQLAQFPMLTLLDLRHNQLTSLDRPRSGNIKELYLAGNAWTCFTREPYRSNIYSRSHLSAHSRHKLYSH